MSEEEMKDRKQEVHSTVVRAGKRTYFLDVKSTHNNDLYLAITESKKVFNDGRPSFKKHKIFLYKEDFKKFSDALEESIQKICELKKEDGAYEDKEYDLYESTSVDFDDL